MTSLTLNEPSALPYPLPDGKRVLQPSDIPAAFKDWNSPHPFLEIAALLIVGKLQVIRPEGAEERKLVVDGRWTLSARVDTPIEVLIACFPAISSADELGTDTHEALWAWVLWSWLKLDEPATA